MKDTMETVTPAVRIVEVGPRDGLQNISQPIPTSTKLELIQRLARTGLRSIELTSVVSPRIIPQLADCREVLDHEIVRHLHRPSMGKDMRLPVLVPNVKGLEIAIAHGVKEVAVFVSATEGFSKANTNCSVAEGIERAKTVAAKAISSKIAVRGYISCIFTDPITSSPAPPSSILHCIKTLLDTGIYEISLGDTLGTGTPSQVRSLLTYLSYNGIPMSKIAGHFHDSYGLALANVWEAYECGIRVFDSSVAGLGGCPFAPGARGNVATEEVVRLFHGKGLGTGVDEGELMEVVGWVRDALGRLSLGTSISVGSSSGDGKVNTRTSATIALPASGGGSGARPRMHVPVSCGNGFRLARPVVYD